MRPSAVPTLSVTLLDGQECELLLSQGGYERLKKRLEAKNLKDVLQRLGETENIGPLLWESLREKDGMTEEQFLDNLPLMVDQEAGNLALKLLRLSFPDRPTPAAEAAPPAEAEISTGPHSGVSPESDSA